MAKAAKMTLDRRPAAPGTGVSVGSQVGAFNRWREDYNPLRGLVISRVVSLLEQGERGEFADLQWLYRFVEKRFAVLRALIVRRRAALQKLDWEVKTVSEFPGAVSEADQAAWEAKAKAQADFLRERYEQITNLKEAIGALGLAEFRGFAHLVKKRNAAGEVVELHWLPQWNFVRDGLYGDWFYNARALSTSWRALAGERIGDAESGAKYDRAEFVIREVAMPINEIGVVAYLRTNLSQKDWDAFVEMFGLAGCVVVMPPNIPQGKEAEYQEAAERIAEGSSGALPAGGDAKFPSASVRGNAPYKEHLEWQEKDVVLSGTGGKLTMLTGPVGLGGGQSEVHEDVFDEIATAEAGEISECLQRDFDRVLLEEKFPGEPVLAFFQLCPVDDSAEKSLQFKREVFKQWMTDGTVSDVLANQTNLKQLTTDVQLPVNEEYEDPYLPVKDETGLIQDVSDGGEKIVGAQRAGSKEQGAGVRGGGEEGEDTDEHGRDDEGGEQGAGSGEVRAARADEGGEQGAGSGEVRAARADGEEEEDTDGHGRDTDEHEVRADGMRNRWEVTAQERLALAVARDLAPVRERLTRILEIEDPVILEGKLREFLGEVEKLKADLGADPAAARAIEEILATGFVENLQQGKVRQS